MKEIPPDHISLYRSKTFRADPKSRLQSKSQAVKYVNERGFIFFWPIKDIVLPSLWVARAGDRRVADAHDGPGHITWSWKDSLLGKKVWYDAKVLKKKSTLISLEIVPSFYALSNNYGSPEEDFLTLYEQGRITHDAKETYNIILESGLSDTVLFRRKLNMVNGSGKNRFNRARVELQSDFKILPIEITQSGGWRYSFSYDIAPRHLPDIISNARKISEIFARKTLLNIYFLSVGAAQRRDVLKLFGWGGMETVSTIQNLINEGTLHNGYSIINHPGEWLIHEACIGAS